MVGGGICGGVVYGVIDLLGIGVSEVFVNNC